MKDDATGQLVMLKRSLAVALDAGQVADDALKGIAIPPKPPKGNSWPFALLPVARLQRKAAFTPSGDQIRRSCLRLDEFKVALQDLRGHIADQTLEETVSSADGWSDRLWESNTNAAAVYNEVIAALSLLNRYRTNLILERPVASPRD